MSFEFVIPLSRDDLLRQTGVNHYAVEEVYSLRILPTKLQGTVPQAMPVTLYTMYIFIYNVYDNLF